ncbi:MAG: DUF222 domain-containing protein [Deltaproteobacteria bacterium]
MESKGNVYVGGARRSWQEIDRELRAIAKRQRALDAEEAVLLCTVVRREIWRELGKGSLLEYLEDVLGYGPKAAKERVRVALALDELPVLANALATGEQSYSAIRELTRVATKQTEAEWLAAVRGKNVRQVEDLVSCHRRGDRPTDPPDYSLKPHVVRFEISTATHARLRHVQQVLADETGGQLDDDAFVTALCDSILDGNASADDGGRARFQILTTVCVGCQQAWQHGGGRDLPIGETDLEIAECDAQRVGSDSEPGTAAQDVAPKVRRFVMLRDRRRCVVPGCRASRHIDVHHIVPRHLGGGHEAENLTLLCSGHHRALHDGTLAITGRAPNLVVSWKYRPDELAEDSPPHATPDRVPHVGQQPVIDGGRLDADDDPPPHVGPLQPIEAFAPVRGRGPFMKGSAQPGPPEQPAPHVGPPPASSYAWIVMKTEATVALAGLGFAKQHARACVEQAAAQISRDAPLERLIREALRLTKRSVA